MAKSVIIVGIDYEYVDAVARVVAENANMMYLSIRDLIAYEMQGLVGNIDFLDSDYVNAHIAKLKLRALEYENTVIVIDVADLNDRNLKRRLKGMPVYYCRSASCDSDCTPICDDRDKLLRNVATNVIRIGTPQSQVRQILSRIAKLPNND